MTPPSAPDLAELLSHVDWVRALARRLVGDADVADDLVQDAFVTALERPPARGGNWPGWLRTVVANAARQRGRRERRRTARERAVARPDLQPAAADAVERAAMQRELVDLVLALEEPFRTTILLRFFDQLEPRAIAARLGIAVNTVHSRVARGLDRLRGRLDADRGGRRAWVPAVAPLLGPAPGAVAAKLVGPGVLVMQAKAKLTIAVVLLLSVGAVPLLLRGGAPPRAEPAPTRTSQAHAEPAAGPEIPAARQPLVEVAAKDRRVAAGTLYDADGRVLPGVRVALRAAGSIVADALSDAAGAFRIPTDREAGRLVAADPQWTTIVEGAYGQRSSVAAVVIAAPRIELAGQVVDEQGLPVAGALVELRLGAGFDQRFRVPLDASSPRAFDATTDPHGVFALADAPAVGTGRLVTTRAGFAEDVQDAPARSDTRLLITLARSGAAPAVRGVVVDAAGRAVAGALVSLGRATRLTATDGTFGFDLDAELAAATTLRAVKAAHLPAFARARDGAARWPAFVRLELGGEPLSVSGRVVDERGAPVPAARVWLDDPTLLGDVDGIPVQIEFVAGGAAPFATAGNGPSSLWAWAESDADGAFELGGLLDRSYRLRAVDTETLLAATTEPIAAGTADALVVLDRTGSFARVAGRVVSRSGEAVGDAFVICACEGFVAASRNGGSVSQSLTGARATTDDDGRFELTGVPRVGVDLLFGGRDVIDAALRLDGREDVEALEVVVGRRCHFRVEPADPNGELAEGFALVDADGHERSISLVRAGSKMSATSFSLVDGRSQVLTTEDGACTLVVECGGRSRHVPVTLRPGDVNVLMY